MSGSIRTFLVASEESTSPHRPYKEPGLQKAMLLYGDPKAEAWAWMHGYAAMLSNSDPDDEDYYVSVSVDELIDTAMANLDEDDEWPNHYISKGGLLESKSVEPMFYEKLALLKDITIPKEKQKNFFSCSC